MRILDLSLTYHWYDMIASGVKKEEYRIVKDFYIKRLTDGCLHQNEQGYYINAKHYDMVRFHRGQGGKVSMLVECKGIRINYGKPEWGAPNEPVFIIELGEIYNFNTEQYFAAVGQVQDLIPYEDPEYRKKVHETAVELIKKLNS